MTIDTDKFPHPLPIYGGVLLLVSEDNQLAWWVPDPIPTSRSSAIDHLVAAAEARHLTGWRIVSGWVERVGADYITLSRAEVLVAITREVSP